jgi:isopenicillin-N epimerase
MTVQGALREHFLLDPSIVFLNHGSFGACPAPVLEVYQALQRELEANPVAFLARESGERLAKARGELARYLHGRPENLIFVPNATTGVNTVARSLPLRAGDEILTTDHEYGACDNTWQFVCRHTGAHYRAVEIPLPFDAEGFTERIWSAVTPRTRVLYLSHITSTTALILPLRELCHRARETDILTLIDGAHAPGHIPLDLDDLGADFYTGNCHKWLCAPKGTAFLHARPERHALLEAPVISWGYSPAVKGFSGFESYTGSTVLERRLQWQGTRDLAAFLSIPAAIAFEKEHHWDRIRMDCHYLGFETSRRIQALTGLPPIAHEGDFGQMVAMPVPAADPQKLQRALLERHRIEVPVTTHRDRTFVRLSLQGYNTPGDAEALVRALEALL